MAARTHQWPVVRRFALLIILLAAPAAADQRTLVVDLDGTRIEVKITERFGQATMVRAECVIPAPHRRVWKVVSDYDRIEEFIPAVKESRVVERRGEEIILEQRGRGGLWFIQREFELRLRVKQVPMSYVGFSALEGDFRKFEGTWQVAPRDEGTWIAHSVEIEPDFFAPGWAVRRVARRMMAETIEGLIRECLQDN